LSALFSSRGGGAALGLSLPGHPRSFEFELKSAKIFFSSGTLQLSETAKTVCSYRKQFSKLKNELSRESYCTRYLAELHGDESQTLLPLCDAYFAFPSLSWQKAPPPMLGMDQLVDSLTFGGPVFQEYSSKVDGNTRIASTHNWLLPRRVQYGSLINHFTLYTYGTVCVLSRLLVYTNMYFQYHPYCTW
jgi:hypothetical protein